MGIKGQLVNCLCSLRYYYVNKMLVVFHVKQLIIQTTSLLGNSKMWFTSSAPTKLTEIWRILSRFEFIKLNQQNHSNVQYLRRVWICKEGRPHFRKLIRRTLFIWIHFILFINYWKSKTIIKPSVNSHVYWDTLCWKWSQVISMLLLDSQWH